VDNAIFNTVLHDLRKN